MPICLCAYMPICLYAYMPICLYAYMPVCLYAYMPICLAPFGFPLAPLNVFTSSATHKKRHTPN